ncbi:hypothetical protein [Variovorax ginsengisoli]|uniref:Uncharacterized protein n=1 Tax=Variovorax ginsengisoli TaxID=363844 RepID=A0ABT8SBP8_9BURK|nr:hypothetical protein [Variovorax ginsengisoli]MDN8616247.1 hypothetical protein [Variovorax ginsengisoli]MDO1535417.1 hypothetical protein [Variovorax ginsengisoli]
MLHLFASRLSVTEIAERPSRSIKTVSRQKNDLDVFVDASEHRLTSQPEG